jgi:hypothetical protein
MHMTMKVDGANRWKVIFCQYDRELPNYEIGEFGNLVMALEFTSFLNGGPRPIWLDEEVGK